MKQYGKRIEGIIQRAFDRCNLIGEDCDVWDVLYSYKTLRQLPEDELDAIYDDIVHDLGFCR